MPALTTIQLRRAVGADWTTADTILAAGEIALETDTGRLKFGDGSTAWTALPYAPAIVGVDTAANWSSNNPVLVAGALGFESDTGKFKLGDGSTSWAVLLYAGRPTKRSFSGSSTVASIDADVFIYTGSGGHTLTLRSASIGGLIHIKNCGTGSLTVAPAGSDTFFASTGGGTSLTLAVGDAVTLIDTASAEWGAL